MIQEHIKNLIEKTLENLRLPIMDFTLDHPDNFEFGDISCNVALALSRRVDENPRELAKKIVNAIDKDKEEDVEDINVAGPGFINFHLSKKFFKKELVEILEKGEGYGSKNKNKGKKIIFEYTDPNPMKQFHIGHLMSNTIGESLSRLAEFEGAKVIRICYGGDVGLHVAKTLWGMKQTKDDFPTDDHSLTQKVEFTGKAYVIGSKAYEEDEKAQAEIKEINKNVFAGKLDAEMQNFYDSGKEWSVLHFHEIYEKLGTKFDHEWFESEVVKRGEEIVKENMGKVFEESEGAIVYKGEKKGLHTRVFTTSLGLPTYETKELGTTERKFKTFNPDLSIVITAHEQADYFKVLLSALAEINFEWSEKTKHISHGMMRFAEGKMGSRTGNVITGESLINDVEEKVKEIVKDRELSEKTKDEIVDAVSIAAIKFSILRQTIGGDIIFNKDKAVSFEGDSGPYLQYTAVRAGSVLEKADLKGLVKNIDESDHVYLIERHFYKFGKIVERAHDEKSPNLIVSYLLELASMFNHFYAEHKIIEAEEDGGYRLAITEATITILTTGLYLLGIKTPERM